MNLFNALHADIVSAIGRMAADGRLPDGLDLSKINVSPPKDETHGDVATNAAMVLAGPAKLKPRDVASLLSEELKRLPNVTGAEVAGPGFLNLRLSDTFWRERLTDVLKLGICYGDSNLGHGKPVNVEYVSANPTGPMHVGHGRGAVFGDALAALLAKAGFKVSREYYVNDAGAQVDVLARSHHWRYREALGEKIGDMPADFYPGDYLETLGKTTAAVSGNAYADQAESEWLAHFRQTAIDAMITLIKADLAALGVAHDVFTSERALVEQGLVQQAVDILTQKGLVYRGTLEPPKGQLPDDWEAREQLLFRSSQFGDDVDRPLQKSDGSWTYFASDIAYHLDKVRRGFAAMIDVWGADHGGYVKRVKAAVTALTDGEGQLDVKLCQMVNLMKDGQPFKMSKRAGTFVTLRDVIDEVGKDVVRFIMLTRKNDAQLDFDLVKVLEQSRDNPVFYVQYAHARAHSVLRHAAEMFPDADLTASGLASVPLEGLTDPAELALIRRMADWPRQVEAAAEAHEPHRIAFYLYDLAASFHGLWNKGKDDATLRFLVADDKPVSLARAALVRGVSLVIASGLAVIGVTPVEEMR